MYYICVIPLQRSGGHKNQQKMNELEKQEAVAALFDKFGKIGKIKNPLFAMKAYVEVAEWLGELFDKGYELGIKEGEKSWAKRMPSN